MQICLNFMEIFDAMKKEQIEPKTIRFVHSKINSEPSMLLIHGVYQGGSELRILPPLILQDENGNEIDVIYYQLIDSQYVDDGDPYKITFSMIPTTHTLNAVLNFAHVDELTPPELMDTQLFLNFKVSYESNEEA